MRELREILARLRQDDGDWRDGQQAMARGLRTWRAEPTAAPVLAAMKRFGDGAMLDHCAALADLFGPVASRAEAFAAGFAAAALAALDAHPLGQLPVPHGSRDAVPSLVLARSGRATLALAVYDGAALARLPAPQTVRFQPRESWLRILAGSAEGEHILRRDSDGDEARSRLQSARLSLQAGAVFHRHGPREALHVRRVQGAMVVLRLERDLVDAGPVRELSLPDGGLVQQASASREDSRDELIVALLGQMQRIDALPALTALALSGPGEDVPQASEALRWQALRELVALDSRIALATLARIAGQGEDPLSPRAASTHAALTGLPNGGASWRG